MYKRITLSYFLLLHLVLFFLFSCKQEQEQEVIPMMESTPLSIEEAQLWYINEHAAHQEVILSKPSGRESYHINRVPLWQFAQNFRLSNGIQAISVPLLYDDKHALGISNQSKLILFKDKEGKYKLQIMKVISNTKLLKKNSQLTSIKEFSGVLLMYDWQENFLSGVKYTNEKITGELSISSSSTNGRIASGCQQIRLEYYSDVCIGDNCSGKRFDYAETILVCSSGGSSGNAQSVHAGSAGEGVNYGNGGGGSASYNNQNNRTEEYKRQAVVRDGEEDLMIPGVNNPSIDLKTFLDCFGASQTSDFQYTLTVYVQEPVPGSNTNSSITGNVGHTCIGLTKADASNSSNATTQIIRFYPQNGMKAVTPPFDPVASEVHDNGIDTRYTVSISYSISPAQFQEAINAAIQYSSNSYDLANNNCNNYAINICNRAGINIPQNKSPLLYTKGYHPV